MIRNLLSTTASRLIIALLNLCIVWLSARYLGAEVLGTIALIILAISIIQLVTAVMAGSSLVYQTSRHPLSSLLIVAWLWIFLSGVPVWLILLILNLIPDGYSIHVLSLSIFGSIITVNQNIFLGKEKINLFNGLAIAQSLIVTIVLGIMILYFKWIDTTAWIIAQYASMVICAVIGALISFSSVDVVKLPGRKLINEAFRFGGFLQAASIMQLFNYRLSYYLIEKFFDRATLGVFSLGVQIAESVWIIARSMAVLLYSRLSNNRNDEYSRVLTINFIKVTIFVTIILIGIILLLPDRFYVFVFRSEFADITTVIASLSIGILSVAISLMFSHYFSGTGKPVHNTISSGIGLVFTIICGFMLIPVMGITGAGITASVSYLSSMLYQLIIFRRMTSVTWSSFIPSFADFRKFKSEFTAMIK